MTADQKLEYAGRVSDAGEITLPKKFRAEVAKLFSGREIVVTFQRKKKRRSLNQNAFYWGVVIKMIKEAMNDAGENVTEQEVHEFLKFRFLRVQRTDPDTAELLYEYAKSTTVLSTVEFCLYLDSCVQFGAEMLGIVIPPPEDKRGEYVFPEFIGKSESRTEYLERIKGYVSDIFDLPQLKRYFAQNPEWQTDDEIRTLFNIRRMEIKGGA